MARMREVGTLWIGGALSWMEQLCLKSFVDKGQKITLFSYDEIPNVPDGVIRRNGREILDTENFIKYHKRNSFALFADLFRLHMIHQCPGMIWVDADVYCHQPMAYEEDYVFGFELPGEHRVNNAVLGMPSDSALLAALLDFTAERYPIPPFLSEHRQNTLRLAAEKGEPVHVSHQNWGIWGPLMMTHFVHEMGYSKHIRPLDAFYPINFRERTLFMRHADLAADQISDQTTAMHLWASNKKELGSCYDGLPPRGSYFDKLVREHAINPALAPIKTRGSADFETALIDAVTSEDVRTICDLTGGARNLALALNHKFGSDIQLANIDNEGRFADTDQPWIAGYVDFLREYGVNPDQIHILRTQQELRPVDVLCNLQGFGDQYPVRSLKPYLDTCLHKDTQVFIDIRHGSRAFPFIKRWGSNVALSRRVDGDKKVTRVRLMPGPPRPTDRSGRWDKTAVRLAGDTGWYRSDPSGHSFLYLPLSSETLVVTFDNLDLVTNTRDDRRPWGYEFIKQQGWSMLGVLAGGWTWYREPWVQDQFDSLKEDGFFLNYNRVVFYGASMGGYAACAFSAAAPGCDVVAISPQSTLDKSVVPWETRYKAGWERDFSGPYGDAATASAAARRVSIFYDPYAPLDARHAARFDNANTRHLRSPLLGHRLGTALAQMGILSPIMKGILSGDLSDHAFHTLLRKRKDFPRYQAELFKRTVASGHTDLARSLGEYILRRNANLTVQMGLQELHENQTS